MRPRPTNQTVPDPAVSLWCLYGVPVVSRRWHVSGGSQVARSVHYNEQESMLLVSLDAEGGYAADAARRRIQPPAAAAAHRSAVAVAVETAAAWILRA